MTAVTAWDAYTIDYNTYQLAGDAKIDRTPTRIAMHGSRRCGRHIAAGSLLAHLSYTAQRNGALEGQAAPPTLET